MPSAIDSVVVINKGSLPLLRTMYQSRHLARIDFKSDTVTAFDRDQDTNQQ